MRSFIRLASEVSAYQTMARSEALLKGIIRTATRAYWAAVSRYRARFGEQYEADPDRPWLEEYTLFGIPETLEPYPDGPLHQFLVDAAETNPTAGLIQLDTTVTYPDILADAERLATALADRGIGRGDRVATILPTSVQFVVVDSAISIAGGVHVPNDTVIATDDLRYRLEASEPDLLVCAERHESLATELAADTGIDTVVVTALEDYSSDPPVHEDRSDDRWLTTLIESTERDPPAVEIDPASDVHTLLFTGGTTGRPKGVRLSHRNLVANVLQTNSISGGASFGSAPSLLAQPLYHAYGYTALHARIEAGGSVALVADARDVEQMAALIDEHGIRIVSGVPTQFMELLEEDIGRKLIAISGSAPLADEVRTAFSDDHIGITQGYGLTEMAPVTHVDIRGLIDSLADTETSSDRFDHPCIGIPVPDTTVKLVDTDSRETLPISTAIEAERAGEMFLNGPQRMLGYLDGTDPTDDEGYIGTGDVVKVDSSGRFYVVDRVKNMVNVSGLKVYTEEVDEVLFEHPGIRRPATIGIPDPDRPGSERVKIYVEPVEDTPIEEDDVVAFLEGRVPDHAMPSSVEIVREIPLTAIGKTDKETLKDHHAGEVEL